MGKWEKHRVRLLALGDNPNTNDDLIRATFPGESLGAVKQAIKRAKSFRVAHPSYFPGWAPPAPNVPALPPIDNGVGMLTDQIKSAISKKPAEPLMLPPPSSSTQPITSDLLDEYIEEETENNIYLQIHPTSTTASHTHTPFGCLWWYQEGRFAYICMPYVSGIEVRSSIPDNDHCLLKIHFCINPLPSMIKQIATNEKVPEEQIGHNFKPRKGHIKVHTKKAIQSSRQLSCEDSSSIITQIKYVKTDIDRNNVSYKIKQDV
eukprot:TRINITY_DN2874_c0_g1_i1.p1 TRINITY_DN2874_c0_g1~~TRINITY_DN2874_c0_g1_i1.p1  ORF type:complete len:288 (+),score=67.79 TRINITY_DN2874_c0_g1_i1:81-866(+)